MAETEAGAINENSSSNASSADLLPSWQAAYEIFHSYVFSWLFPILMLLGVWGNSSCLLVLLRHPKCFPYSVRLCMLITCCVDLLLVGGKSVTHYLAPSVLGQSLGVPNYRTETNFPVCVAYYLVTLWLLHGSPFLRLGFCLHSLVVTLAPMRQRRLLRRRNIAMWQALLLLLSFLPCIRVSSAYWSNQQSRCLFRENNWIELVYRLYTVFAARLLVFATLLASLAVILASLRRSQRDVNGSIASSGRGVDSGFVHPAAAAASAQTRIFASTSFIFIACEAPYAMMKLLEHLDALTCTGNMHLLLVLLNHLVYLNPALNWLPYLIGKKFRCRYRAMVSFCKQAGAENGNRLELTPSNCRAVRAE